MYTLKKDPFSSHSKIVKLINSNLPGGSILDIGCASGFIGSRLSAKKYRLYGIDSDEKLLMEARKFYRGVWCADIEKNIPDLKIKFDLLVFADILEHLKDPASTLKKFLVLGKNNALVIISVPNVANVVIRSLLLLGHFDYMEKGILDKSHLRFFTLSTFKRMVKDVDLEILKVEATPLPFPQVFPLCSQGRPFFFLSILANFSASLWKSMFAYQLIVLARKK